MALPSVRFCALADERRRLEKGYPGLSETTHARNNQQLDHEVDAHVQLALVEDR